MLLALDERENPSKTLKMLQKECQESKNQKSIIKRIVEELEGPLDKHYIFVRAPSEPKQFHTGGYNRGFTRPNYPPRKY